MKVKNKKGFTLLELLVVMIIFTTTIFLGYQVINKSQRFSNKQHKVNDIQLGINNLKKYLTEDLKKCKSVDLLNTDTDSNYSYKINMDESNLEQIIYEVKYKTRGEKQYYSISRISNKEEMVLIDNQDIRTDKLDNELTRPLFIYTTKNPYSVIVNYGSLDSELYTFDVYNEGIQLSGTTPIPDPPDIIDPPSGMENNYLSYCLNMAKELLYDAKEKLPPGIGKKLQENMINDLERIIPIAQKNPITELEYKDLISTVDILLEGYSKNKPMDRVVADYMNEAESYLEAGKYTIEFDSKVDISITSDSIWQIKSTIVNDLKVVDLKRAEDNLKFFKDRYGEQKNHFKEEDMINKIQKNFNYIEKNLDIGLKKCMGNELYELVDRQMQFIYNDLRTGKDINELLDKTASIINKAIDDIIDYRVEVQRFIREEVPVDKGNSENDNSSKVPQYLIDNMRKYGYEIVGCDINSPSANTKIVGALQDGIKHLVEIKYNLNRTNYYDPNYNNKE